MTNRKKKAHKEMRREREAKLTVVSWLSDIAVEVCEESEQRDDRAPWKKHFNIH